VKKIHKAYYVDNVVYFDVEWEGFKDRTQEPLENFPNGWEHVKVKVCIVIIHVIDV
jgi:hypothetical protein